MKLLIAEPSKSVSELIKCVCHSEGFECDIANDIAKMDELLGTEEFDIICLAPNLGKEKGIEVLKRIRKIEKLSFVPIFLFTSSPDSKAIRDAISAGATDLIDKSDFESLGHFLSRFRENRQLINGSVLVVEDSKLQQNIFSVLLSNLGCEATFVDNAEDAFELCKKNQYDLVIVDIVLKGAFSGVALAGRIRRMKGVAGDVPILAATGYDDSSRESSLYAYGVNDYIKKPIDETVFKRKVRNLIRSFQDYKELELKTEALVKSDRSRVAFWANLSHEIKTPLNGVAGALHLIKNEDVSNEKQEYIQAAKDSSEMLLSLVNDVLALTKAESGHLHYSPRIVRISEALDKQMSMMKGLADEKGLELKSFLDKNLTSFIECDLVRLNQVLTNMLNNAIKFTQKGSVTLSCKILDDGSEPMLKFMVKDTGIGISAEDKEKVFSRFGQANSKIEEDYGGSGIGLHIAKLIVNMWGGEIGVDSALGKGCCFWFTMPYKLSENISESEEDFLIFANPQDKKVLAVDDAEINLMVIKGFLKELNIPCDTAARGKEALELINKNHYDCIFMDWHMPEMNGDEATKKIRNLNAPKCNIPVIALTAKNSDEEEYKKAGMNGFLPKPFEQPQLIKILNHFLDESNTHHGSVKKTGS
ncbi:MAG: response regulator [Gammaproteobacteria bacterium]|nr:response regulator [Gammaproteobacteria bacterium]MDH5630786.1 response regulator [Gammaproteobacteria bacterium]